MKDLCARLTSTSKFEKSCIAQREPKCALVLILVRSFHGCLDRIKCMHHLPNRFGFGTNEGILGGQAIPDWLGSLSRPTLAANFDFLLAMSGQVLRYEPAASRQLHVYQIESIASFAKQVSGTNSKLLY